MTKSILTEPRKNHLQISVCGFLGLIALKYLTMSSYNGLKPYINIKISLVHAAVKDQ